MKPRYIKKISFNWNLNSQNKAKVYKVIYIELNSQNEAKVYI